MGPSHPTMPRSRNGSALRKHKMNRFKRALTTISNTGGQFLQSTTLHGFKYFRDPHTTERLFWMLVHVLNACCASVLCLVLWQRFLQNPSILALQAAQNDDSLPEPYPVITICPPHRISREAAAQFVGKLTLPTGLQRSYLVDIVPQLAAVLAPSHIQHTHQDLLMLDLVLSANNVTYLKALTELSPTCAEFLYRCSWNRQNILCEKLFRQVVVRSGICCSFNRPIDQWKTTSDSTSAVPNKAFMMMPFSQLSVVVNVSARMGYNPVVDYPKFKVEDISLNSQKTDYLAVPPGSEYWLEATRVQVVTSDDDNLAVMSCERKNNAIPYSRHICQMKCIVEAMVARCGCVAPTYQWNYVEGVPCLPSRTTCLRTIRDDKIKSSKTCRCVATCDESRILSELQVMPITALEYTVIPFYRGVTKDMLVLRLQMTNQRSRLYVQEPTVSWVTLLSSLGGVFNMFLGVGVVSLVEIFYFLAIRLPLNARRSRQASHVDDE